MYLEQEREEKKAAWEVVGGPDAALSGERPCELLRWGSLEASKYAGKMSKDVSRLTWSDSRFNRSRVENSLEGSG